MSIIKIPSSCIYSISNPKIIKNAIGEIEVNANKVNVQIDKDNLSYTETVFVQSSSGEVIGQTTYTTSNKDFDTQSVTIEQTSGAMPNVEFQLLTYSEMKLGYLSIPIKIYANSYQDKYITGLYRGKDQDGNDRIEYAMDYMSIQLSASGSWQYADTQTKTPSQYDTVSFTYSTDNPIIANKTGKILNDRLSENPQNQVNVIDNNIKYAFQFSPQPFKPQNATNSVTLSVSNSISLADKTNVSTAYFTEGIDENGKYYAITLNVLVSRIITTLINSDYSTVYVTAGSRPNPRPMIGTQYRDVATQIRFTFHGETRFLNITELTQYIGEKNGKQIFSVENNELLQTTNRYNDEDAIQATYTATLNQYKNGKETAVILCSISDYKDTNGKKVIDITTATSNKMMFDIGDEVIPMIYTANGIDVPMSVDKAGNAKVFRVVGTKPYDEGIARQELTLQEK